MTERIPASTGADIMPEYRQIEGDELLNATRGLEAKHRAITVELNNRLERMLSVLEEVHAIMEARL